MCNGLAVTSHGGDLLVTEVFPKENAKDLRDIPRRVLRNLRLVPVSHMDEVLRTALALDEPGEVLKEPSVAVWRIPIDRRGNDRRVLDARIPVASSVPPAPVPTEARF